MWTALASAARDLSDLCALGQCGGLAPSKHRIFQWVRDTISLAFELLHLRALELTLLKVWCLPRLFLEESLRRTFVLRHTFIKFYNLDLDGAPGSWVLST